MTPPKRHERQGGHEDRAVDGDEDADVADAAGALGVLRLLAGGRAEQLDEQGAGDVEALGHPRAHVGVEVHLPVRQRGEATAHEARRDDEQRDEQERTEGQLPGQGEHRSDDEDDGDDVADDVGQDRREGLLRADDVAVEPRHERPGLGSREEGDRLLEDVGEDLGAQVVDEALPDARGVPPRHDGEPGVEHGERRDDEGEADDDTGVLRDDAVVDDRLEQQRHRDDEERVEHDDGEEGADGPLVRTGIRQDPAPSARGEGALGHGRVA
jgi:hypothetical protein